MIRFSVYGIRYENAIKLINDLKEYNIESNITIGGIAIYPDGTIETDKMNLVCAFYNTKAFLGATLIEEHIIYKK